MSHSKRLKVIKKKTKINTKFCWQKRQSLESKDKYIAKTTNEEAIKKEEKKLSISDRREKPNIKRIKRSLDARKIEKTRRIIQDAVKCVKQK